LVPAGEQIRMAIAIRDWRTEGNRRAFAGDIFGPGHPAYSFALSFRQSGGPEYPARGEQGRRRYFRPSTRDDETMRADLGAFSVRARRRRLRPRRCVPGAVDDQKARVRARRATCRARPRRFGPEQNRKLFLEVAEFAQNFDSRLTAWEDRYARGGYSAAETVHRDLLTARPRTLNSPLMMQAWNALVLTDDYVQSCVDLGNFEIDPDGDRTWIDMGEYFMIGGHVAVEAVMLAATAALGPKDDLPLFGPLASTLAAQVRASYASVHDADDTDRGKAEGKAARQLQAVLEISRTFSANVNPKALHEAIAAIEATGRPG